MLSLPTKLQPGVPAQPELCDGDYLCFAADSEHLAKPVLFLD